MENERLYGALAEILEVESVKDGDVLRDFEAWDSLTKLSIIALAGSDYKVIISAKDLDAIGTVGELKSFLENHGR